ncbi:acyl-CoA thioesterase [Sulfitobacter noctilucae]|uniref:acyl-CoA thioesterase n=1 Tax=Sulfitobacter noctilucae TaxID=1342302 RepID=UPI00046830AD|nr:acyl-CoA thioesterase II [Sulfitobacter noctilucae]
MTPAEELLHLLNIEQLEVDLFRGIGGGGETTTRIFGGHVIAQSLMAAYRTVEYRLCHSLHAYFIRPGDPSIPVIYQVDRARDGGSFTTRRVVAIQHGKQIFNMSASFHVAEDGWDYQHPMKDVGSPDDWPDRNDLRASFVEHLPKKYHADFMRERPIELREVKPREFLDPEVADDVNQLWFRMEAAKGQDVPMQHCLLAYASDMNLLGSSLRPHGLTWFQGKVMTASLDHAMWFHAPIEFADWHLYDLDAPWTGGGRGFNRGSIYRQDGQMVASVAQEGLMRPLKPKST